MNTEIQTIELFLITGLEDSLEQIPIGNITKNQAGELTLYFKSSEYEEKLRESLTKMMETPQLLRGGGEETDGTTGAIRFVSWAREAKPTDPDFMRALEESIRKRQISIGEARLSANFKRDHS